MTTFESFTFTFTSVNIVQTTNNLRAERGTAIGGQETKLTRTRIPVYQSGNYAHEIK